MIKRKPFIKTLSGSLVSRQIYFLSVIISNIFIVRSSSPEEFSYYVLLMLGINFKRGYLEAVLNPIIIKLNLSKQSFHALFSNALKVFIPISFIFTIYFFLLNDFENLTYFTLTIFGLSPILILHQRLSSLLFRESLFLHQGLSMAIAEIIGLAAFIILLNLNIFIAFTSKIVVSVLFSYMLCYFLGRKYINNDSSDSAEEAISIEHFQSKSYYLNYISKNLDTAAVGLILGNSIMAIYERAFSLVKYIVTFLALPLNSGILSFFRQSKDDNYFLRHIELIVLLSLISSLVGGIMVMLSEQFISLLYGRNWVTTVPYFEIIALSLPFQMSSAISGGFFLSMKRQDLIFNSTIFSVVIILIPFCISILFFDLIQSVIILVIGVMLSWLYGHFLLYTKCMKKGFKNFLFSLTPVLISFGSLCLIYYVK